MQLTSTKNPLLQIVRRAALAGRPTEEGLIVAEGPHLLEEALRSQWSVEQIFATLEARHRYSEIVTRADAELIELSARTFTSIAATQTSQEILALVRPRKWSWEDLLGPSALILALDSIQDPGNAGTIVRSSEAFGASGVVFLKGCARVANAKLLRATSGSIFRVPFLEAISAEEFVERIRPHGIKLYALSGRGSTELSQTEFRRACALAVGSEGAGISDGLLAEAETISIPTVVVESLNAAVAASIALFEAQRQRSAR